MSPTLRHRHSHLLLDYWGSLDRGETPPSDHPSDRRVLQCLKPALCVVEFDGRGDPQYRLAGADVAKRVILRNNENLSFGISWAPRDLDDISFYFWQAADDGFPFYYVSEGVDCFGNWHIFETLWVPFRLGPLINPCYVGISNSLNDYRGAPGPLIGQERLRLIESLGRHPRFGAVGDFSWNDRPYLRLVTSR